jgi:hypothetical protein
MRMRIILNDIEPADFILAGRAVRFLVELRAVRKAFDKTFPMEPPR